MLCKTNANGYYVKIKNITWKFLLDIGDKKRLKK